MLDNCFEFIKTFKSDVQIEKMIDEIPLDIEEKNLFILLTQIYETIGDD